MRILTKYIYLFKLVALDNERAKEEIKSLVSTHDAALHPGIWKAKWLNEKVYFIREKSLGENYFKEYSRQIIGVIGTKRKIKQVIRNVLAKNIRISIEKDKRFDSHSCCDLVVITVHGSFVFYNFDDHKIIKEYENEFINKKYKLLEENNYWEYFNTPVISASITSCVEKMIIEHRRTNDEEIMLFKETIKNYIRYFAETKPSGNVLLSDLIRDLCLENQLNFIMDTRMKQYKVNYYCLHGDLNTWNAISQLVDNTDNPGTNNLYTCFIDYEYAAFYPFFYDIVLFCIDFSSDIKVRSLLSTGNNEILELISELFGRQGWDFTDNLLKILISITVTIYTKTVLANLNKAHYKHIESIEVAKVSDFIYRLGSD